MTHPAVVVDGCWWWRDGYKSLYLLIDMTSLVISYEHLISVVWHVFVKRNQMALRSLGYAIIMFLESHWHEIWVRYMDKLVGRAAGLHQSALQSTWKVTKLHYHNILLPIFHAFPVETGYWRQYAERDTSWVKKTAYFKVITVLHSKSKQNFAQYHHG